MFFRAFLNFLDFFTDQNSCLPNPDKSRRQLRHQQHDPKQKIQTSAPSKKTVSMPIPSVTSTTSVTVVAIRQSSLAPPDCISTLPTVTATTPPMCSVVILRVPHRVPQKVLHKAVQVKVAPNQAVRQQLQASQVKKTQTIAPTSKMECTVIPTVQSTITVGTREQLPLVPAELVFYGIKRCLLVIGQKM